MGVGNNHRRTLHRDAKEQLGKFQRQPDAAMRVRITREIAGVQRDPAPGHPLHIRHFRPLIDARGVMNLLFQNRENACRARMARSSRANTRPRDADTVTIDICHLLGDTGDDQ